MKSNNIVAAPMCVSVASLFNKWTVSNPGNMRYFYKFLTVPSVERSLFLEGIKVKVRFCDNVAMRIY